MKIFESNEHTLHGYFSRDRQPIATVQSGETVRFRTIDANWGYVDGDEIKISPLIERDPLRGHAIIGPIAIEGAKKGMTLEVQIGEIKVDTLGWVYGGGADSHLWNSLGVGEPPFYKQFWQLDADAGVARFQDYTVSLAPFMGLMGMPPDEDGLLPTPPPRFCGGNLDCKELTSGTSLFLPIAVDGGLFSVGDGHAVQGDGEMSLTAIECAMQSVDLTFVLHPEMQIKNPRARIHGGWITLGFNEDLDLAVFDAANGMLDLLMEQRGISRKEALMLASLVVDLRVTQIVNGVKGAHAFLPDNAIR
jgi:acetamidase/formamidase